LVRQICHKPNKLEGVFLLKILPSGDKKKQSSNISTKDFLGKFLENSQDYEEEKGRSCHI
jgi:hypothetical protein